MNRSALRPTDMFIGRPALIGTSMVMGCFSRTHRPFLAPPHTGPKTDTHSIRRENRKAQLTGEKFAVIEA